jgi:hypothetical protein
MKQKHFVKCCGAFLCVKETKGYKRIAIKIKGYRIDCSCDNKIGGALRKISKKDLVLYTHWACHSALYWELLV